jgi:hypothetical protein
LAQVEASVSTRAFFGEAIAHAGGLLGEALAEEGLAAALAVEAIGYHDIEASAGEQRDHGLWCGQEIVAGRVSAEHAGGAGGEIHHAVAGLLGDRDGSVLGIVAEIAAGASRGCARSRPQGPAHTRRVGNLAEAIGQRIGSAVADDGAAQRLRADAQL